MSRSKRSLGKIKLLSLLMLMTIVLMITATYAWFSTQRDVEITGMRLNVEVAESMQISLDGEVWTNSIQIFNMKQLYGTYEGAEGTTVYDAVKISEGGNSNYVPTELRPVSSAGTVSAGKLQLVSANFSGTKLSDIALCTETDLTDDNDIGERQENNAKHPYLVFDMYLRNISARTSGTDPLLLNAGSNVWVNSATIDDGEQEGKGVSGTGLEYSARVGMIVYGNTISTTATGDASETIGEKIRGIAADGDEVAAIWEPNDKEHIPYVVANNRVGITTTTQAVETKPVSTGAVGTTIEDIYATNSNLVTVNTFKPAYTLGSGVDTKTAITDVNNGAVGLAPNAISKVRVYIWLEGQDPDCVDLASTGDKLNINLKLIKDPYTEGVGGNSYAGTGSGSGSGGGSGSGTEETEIGSADEITTADYGVYVTNYTPTNGVKNDGIGWRIFHTDGANIYLIADNYVKSSYAPNIEKDEAYQHVLIFDGIMDDYIGSEDITEDNPARKWLSQYLNSGYSSSADNMKATAYLMDINQWSGFKDNSNAEYAIGGPTVELFAASYNKIYTGKTIQTQVIDEGGYQIKWSDDANFASEPIITGLEASDGLYYLAGNELAYGQYLASPADGTGYHRLLGTSTQGDLRSTNILENDLAEGGIRPIVCLKSSVELEKEEQGDGTYTYKIVE